MLPLKNLVLLLRQAVDRWNADRAPRLAAALAYYATFSLAPLALVTIWIAGWIFGDATAQRYLIDLIAQNFGADSATFVQEHDRIGLSQLGQSAVWIHRRDRIAVRRDRIVLRHAGCAQHHLERSASIRRATCGAAFWASFKIARYRL